MERLLLGGGSCQTDKYPSKCFISIFIELDRKAQRDHDIDINVFSPTGDDRFFVALDSVLSSSGPGPGRVKVR